MINFFENLMERRLDNLDSADAVMINHALNSRRQKYNIDMLESLEFLESQNKIKILDIAFDYAPPNDLQNPGTLVVWERKKANK